MNEPDDFRSAVDSASRQAIASLFPDGKTLPEQSGISYCLKREEDISNFRRTSKRLTILWLLIGIFSLGGGWLLAAMSDNKQLPDWTLYAVIPLLPFGIFSFFNCAMQETRRAKKFLREKAGDFWAEPNLHPISVRIENASTYHKLKVIAEDVGLLIVHPDSRSIQVEGVGYRYLIYAGDMELLECRKSRESEAVVVGYRAGGVRLDLAFVPASILAAFKRKLVIGDSGLHERIQRVLQADTSDLPQPPRPSA